MKCLEISINLMDKVLKYLSQKILWCKAVFEVIFLLFICNMDFYHRIKCQNPIEDTFQYKFEWEIIKMFYLVYVRTCHNVCRRTW